MAEPRSRIIDGMKFMWDGRDYDSVDEALEVKEEYEQDNFETRLLEEDEKVQIYTRRVVAEVVVNGEPPM
ncbi:MAG: hypothetical protein WBH85_04370 [Thermoanaerobaculia bacterium]